MHRGSRATQQAAPAKTYMQNKAETKTKPNEFPDRNVMISDSRSSDGISFLLVWDKLKEFIETLKESKKSTFDSMNALKFSYSVYWLVDLL